MPEKKAIKIRCPRCRTEVSWEDNPSRPFCSERCRLIDLGRWADEEYRIPERRTDDEERNNVVDFPGNNDNNEE